KSDLSGLKEQHGVPRSPLPPPKHLHRVRRCDDDRPRGVADMDAGWRGLVGCWASTSSSDDRDSGLELPWAPGGVRGVVGLRRISVTRARFTSLRAEHYGADHGRCVVSSFANVALRLA